MSNNCKERTTPNHVKKDARAPAPQRGVDGMRNMKLRSEVRLMDNTVKLVKANCLRPIATVNKLMVPIVLRMRMSIRRAFAAAPRPAVPVSDLLAFIAVWFASRCPAVLLGDTDRESKATIMKADKKMA